MEGGEAKGGKWRGFEEMPAHPWGERSGSKGAEHHSLRGLACRFRGMGGGGRLTGQVRRERERKGERCAVAVVKAKTRRSDGTWEKIKENDCSPKVVL